MDDVTQNGCPFLPGDPNHWNYTFPWTSVMFFICFTVSKLNDRYKSWKTAENTTIIKLYHYINPQKKKVKDITEIIKITEKLSIKTLKTWELFLNNYYRIYFWGFWDKRWITLEHPFYRTVSSEYLYWISCSRTIKIYRKKFFL